MAEFIKINVVLRVLADNKDGAPCFTEGPYRTQIRIRSDGSLSSGKQLDGDYDNDFEVTLDVEKEIEDAN